MYVIQYHRQLERIREMVTLRKNEETLEAFYHDPKTGQLWKSFFPNRTATYSGPKLLRPEPLPDKIESQLELCLNSDSDSDKDAIGLAIEYASKPEYWNEIITILEANRKQYSRASLLVFLNHLGVLTLKQTHQYVKNLAHSPSVSEEDLKKLRKRAQWLRFKKYFSF